MTFEDFMGKNYPGVWDHLKEKEENHQKVAVSVGMLRGLWIAGQESILAKQKEASDTGPGGLIRPREMKFVPKKWGWEQWIYNCSLYCGKKLFIKQGHWLSFHHHNIKDEVLYVDSGRMWMTYENHGVPFSIEMPTGYAYHVKPHIKHQMQAIEDTMLIEVSTHHDDEDSIRTTRDLIINNEDDGK